MPAQEIVILAAFLSSMAFVERWFTILLSLPSYDTCFPKEKDEKALRKNTSKQQQHGFRFTEIRKI